MYIIDVPQRLFELGQVVATPGALDALATAGVMHTALIARHISGDWGDLCAEDKESNQDALTTGARILSAYTLATKQRVWVITEWDRSATTLLLPSEY